MAADWASLPPDLVNSIADRILATDDLDYYMDLRAVCHAWRASTADPKANPADPRFHPHRWVALDEPHHSDECRLFVNLATGRFVRKDMPMLRWYYLIAGAAGGQLVLADRSHPNAARVLNPFTGGLIRFKAQVPDEMKVVAHVIGTSPPTLVLVCARSHTVYFADADDASFCIPSHDDNIFSDALVWMSLVCCIYSNAREKEGSLKSRFSSSFIDTMVLVANMFDHLSDTEKQAATNDFIVDCDGETLVVFKLRQGMKVFKIDTVANVVEPVKDLGSRALFVGECRSLCVDVNEFPSVVSNSIYHIFVNNLSNLDFGVCVYSLKDQNEVTLQLGSPPLTVLQLLSFHASSVRSSQVGREGMLARIAEQKKALLGLLFGHHESSSDDNDESDEDDDDESDGDADD